MEAEVEVAEGEGEAGEVVVGEETTIESASKRSTRTTSDWRDITTVFWEFQWRRDQLSGLR